MRWRRVSWRYENHPLLYYIVALSPASLQLVLTNESPFCESSLRCVKLYGDKVLLGGTGGFFGIGMIGQTTDLTIGVPRRVLYVVKCRLPDRTTNAMSVLSSDDIGSPVALSAPPHSSNSEIRFFAWAEQTDIFVAADDQRTLSFWHLHKEQTAKELVASPLAKKKPGFYYDCKPEFQSAFNLSQIDFQKKYAGEQITAVYFLNEQSFLVVSTNMRLLLLDVAYMSSSTGRRREGRYDSHQENKFGVVGFGEIDSVDRSDQRGLFALNVVEPIHLHKSPASIGSERRLSHRSASFMERRIVQWRVVTDVEGASNVDSEDSSGAPSCLLKRDEWSAERLNMAIRSIRPI